MNQAKIRLSQEEQDLVTRGDWILTKNRIMEKAGQLLADLQGAQLTLLKDEKWWDSVGVSTPKISRGENYLGLPYLVLDHPRIFGTKDVFAIRTFFWWGHFFSTTLQLSGKFKSTFKDALQASFEKIKTENFLICIADSPWHYHTGTDNYQAAGMFTPNEFRALTEEKTFIKVSQVLPLSEWNEAPQKLLEIFSRLLAILRD